MPIHRRRIWSDRPRRHVTLWNFCEHSTADGCRVLYGSGAGYTSEIAEHPPGDRQLLAECRRGHSYGGGYHQGPAPPPRRVPTEPLGAEHQKIQCNVADTAHGRLRLGYGCAHECKSPDSESPCKSTCGRLPLPSRLKCRSDAGLRNLSPGRRDRNLHRTPWSPSLHKAVRDVLNLASNERCSPVPSLHLAE